LRHGRGIPFGLQWIYRPEMTFSFSSCCGDRLSTGVFSGRGGVIDGEGLDVGVVFPCGVKSGGIVIENGISERLHPEKEKRRRKKKNERIKNALSAFLVMFLVFIAVILSKMFI